MVELKQSTAVTVKFGPFLDKTDGVTEETGLTIAQADIRLSKNGGNIAQSNNVAGASHDELGYFDIPLDTTDTNTLGILRVAVHDKTTHLPVWQDFAVVTANYWDSKYGTDIRQADLTQIGGDTQSGTDLKDFADAGYDPETNKVQGADIDTLLTRLTAARAAVLSDWIDGGRLDLLLDAIKAKTDNEVDATIPEQSAGAPPVTPTKEEWASLIYHALVKKVTETATEQKLHKADGTVICKATVSDDSTTFTRDNFVAP
jgi:hypothetical protein